MTFQVGDEIMVENEKFFLIITEVRNSYYKVTMVENKEVTKGLSLMFYSAKHYRKLTKLDKALR